MNKATLLENLDRTIWGKVKLLETYERVLASQVEGQPRTIALVGSEVLKINIEELRNIRADVELL